MFRKVTVLSLQGGTETGLDREADDRAKTHIGKHFCPGVYVYVFDAYSMTIDIQGNIKVHKYLSTLPNESISKLSSQ